MGMSWIINPKTAFSPGLGLLGGAYGLGQLAKKEDSPSPAPIPEVPASVKETAAETITASQQTAVAAAQEQAKAAARNATVLTPPKKRVASRSRSVFTSPLGLAGEATTIKKILLGE
uniref:Uncharacterized protein n=1 Tax=viral metagenome TaxID=1070528 RepID=A0A6M3ITJ5_9ZZZZ